MPEPCVEEDQGVRVLTADRTRLYTVERASVQAKFDGENPEARCQCTLKKCVSGHDGR